MLFSESKHLPDKRTYCLLKADKRFGKLRSQWILNLKLLNSNIWQRRAWNLQRKTTGKAPIPLLFAFHPFCETVSRQQPKS